MKRPAAHWQILAARVLATLTAMAFRGLFPGSDGAGNGFVTTTLGGFHLCR